MSELADLVARLPWVTRLGAAQDCDGYRYGHMPLKALRDPAVRAKYKCRNRARWRFRALKRGATPPRDGTYCWPHLWSLGLYHGTDEEARTRRGLAKLREPGENVQHDHEQETGDLHHEETTRRARGPGRGCGPHPGRLPR